ncbi:MAG: hypothetical protein OXE52_13150 [Chloroflexi bacterium]|nr:hypothetical protein [Chloroflexota bacterium]
MSFRDRNSNESQSVDNEGISMGSSSAADGGGFPGSLRSNVSGVFGNSKFSDSAPKRSTVATVLIGMVLGMAAAYVVFPAEFTGAAPRHMSQGAIDQWVRMVAVGHSQEIHYDDANALIALEKIPNPQSVVARLGRNTNISASEREAIASLEEIAGFDNLTGAIAPADPGLIASGLQIVLALAAVAIAAPVLVIAWRSVVPGGSSDSSGERRAARNAAGSAAQVAPRARSKPQASPSATPAPQWPEEETEKSGVVHPQLGVPVLHTVSTYVKGQNYDESFAIELGPEQGNQFLGECGISTATRVGNELQAIEFWGFDMASQETLTKVFAAPAAISDPALIAAVGNRVKDPAADIVAATSGATLVVDTYSIQLQAEIKNVVCNYGGGAPNSGIDNLQLEILAWQKQGQQVGNPATSAAPAAENPFIDYSNMDYASSEQMPSTLPPPPAVGQFDPAKPDSRRAAAGQRPEDDEDDPFGGTGNFMPYS